MSGQDQPSPAPHNIIVAVGSSKWVMPAECVPVVANFFDAIRRQGAPVVRDFDANGWRLGGWQPSMDIEFANTDVIPEAKEAKDES
ncbi:MAG: hypothetical protein H8E27_01645 [Verrucomicrobia subdivision 3 bacterium]|nr:hypothetical protein [Limisphaerales bacterium]